jgi:hypothetical protein
MNKNLKEENNETPNFKIGQTEVVVKKKVVDERGKEYVSEVKRGVIVGLTTHFARVWDDSKNSSDTLDASHAELFPIKGNICWIEVKNERKTKVFIPPVLRN